MERITLTTPEIVPQIQTPEYWPISIRLEREPQPFICVVFRGTNGERKEWRVDDPVRAQQLLKALNTARLDLKSLERRCIEQAIADGVFAGTVSGAPDA